MKNYLKLIACILLCEAVGFLGSIFTFSSIPTWYAALVKPSFSPPSWIFGPVWTVLYALMGISLYLIWMKGYSKHKSAVLIFFIQLALNFIWTPAFFGLHQLLLALIIIILLWIEIFITIRKFYRISKTAAYLLIPYLLWVSFATALNFAILILN
jgi:benzodiazapine receptor